MDGLRTYSAGSVTWKNMERIHRRKREAVRECIGIAEQNRNIRRMIIFGSSVTDFCDENSDLDICLDITGSSKNLEMFNSVADMSGVCGGECDILIYDHIAGPLKKTIDRKGVVVYELS